LLKYRKGKAPGEAQKKARLEFPKQVARSKLTLRDASVSIPSVGQLLIIGIASYSAEELALLDGLAKSLQNGNAKVPDIAVFDVLDCQKISDFERFIPGIDGVQRTPVIGVIFDGKLIDHATGLSEVMEVLQRFNVVGQS